jgi:hypothetical protein
MQVRLFEIKIQLFDILLFVLPDVPAEQALPEAIVAAAGLVACSGSNKLYPPGTEVKFRDDPTVIEPGGAIET